MADLGATPSVPPAGPPGGAAALANRAGPESLRRAARELETVFLTQMLEHMSAGVGADGPFGGGNAERLWRSSLNEHYAKSMAGRGGIGIADAIYRDLLRWQEVQK